MFGNFVPCRIYLNEATNVTDGLTFVACSFVRQCEQEMTFQGIALGKNVVV